MEKIGLKEAFKLIDAMCHTCLVRRGGQGCPYAAELQVERGVWRAHCPHNLKTPKKIMIVEEPSPESPGRVVQEVSVAEGQIVRLVY